MSMVETYPAHRKAACLIKNPAESLRLRLKALHRFQSTVTAVEEMTAMTDGKLGTGLKKFLTDEVVGKGKGKESLVVVDPKLGTSQR